MSFRSQRSARTTHANQEIHRVRSSNSPATAIVELARERTCDIDLDCVIVFTGPEGLGKSTAAWTLLAGIDPTFGADRIAWTPKKFLELASQINGGEAILFDEVVQGMHNRSSMSQQNKDMAEFLHICRAWNRVMGICYPRFDGLDLVIREHRAWLWVRVLGIGRAELRLRDHTVPVGETESDALAAYPIVGGMRWNKIDTPGWKKAQVRKDRYLHRFVQERVEQAKS